ncbi:selenocysteine lyase [Lottiidibacillus patelloidae]|uniref:Selenocysteine lyase n=1 Tax=Lottiidibacillus patelloidae TaxID=2670334 RepID=A0A263BU13_9BACI|nr:aminotransferase class V-fold PLP-dependent enzyme [Lottiidibacillus patelloidae]OZM57175.1 selenocysteine lyase [Lottiidibacillus patelloidae]
MQLEAYFQQFRSKVIGNSLKFKTQFGEKELIYADWTASGRLYQDIEDYIVNELGPFVANTHTEANVTGTTMTKLYKQSLQYIKQHVNANSSDVIITDGSGMTSVVNKLQRILGLKVPEKFANQLSIKEEDRPVIFITHMEHHSNQLSWQETIGEVVCIPPTENGLVNLEELKVQLKKYEKRKVKIGSFTACSNVTGITTPYHQLAKIMHEHGGICFVDFAASAPYVDINMHPEDSLEKLDGIYFSPHKFLGGPGTSGVLIFDSALYSNQSPDHPGGGTVHWTNPWGGKGYIDDIETRENSGTPGFLQTIKTALAIMLKEEMGINNILQREKEILSFLFEKLLEIPKLHILAENNKDRLGIISFYIEDIHYNLVVRLLNDRYGIQVRGGCSCAGTYGHYLLHISEETSKSITDKIDRGDLAEKPGWVRLSIHPVMTTDEVNKIVLALKEIVDNIDEYQQDYTFDILKSDYLNKRQPNDTQITTHELLKFKKYLNM